MEIFQPAMLVYQRVNYYKHLNQSKQNHCCQKHPNRNFGSSSMSRRYASIFLGKKNPHEKPNKNAVRADFSADLPMASITECLGDNFSVKFPGDSLIISAYGC